MGAVSPRGCKKVGGNLSVSLPPSSATLCQSARWIDGTHVRADSVCRVGARERDGPRPVPNGQRPGPLAARVPANRLLLSRRAPGTAHLPPRLPALRLQLAVRRYVPRAAYCSRCTARCSLPHPTALVSSSTLLPAPDIIGSVSGARPGHSLRGEPAVYSREQHFFATDTWSQGATHYLNHFPDCPGHSAGTANAHLLGASGATLAVVEQ